LPTETKVTPWHISINGEYFVVLQVPMGSRTSHRCLFFNSDKKAKFKNSPYSVVKEMPMYVDMETACDVFAKEFYQNKVKETQEEENF